MKRSNSWLKTIWEDREKRIILGLCLFLTITIAAVYGQTVGFDFVDYDDPKYVNDNPRVPEGLTWDGIKWAFITSHGGYWHPTTWLSLMLDREIFGVGAGGFHFTNVLLHIANTVLLFWILRRYTKTLWPSFFVAAFFGLHPLHVESVAWVTERKDVLSTLFFFLTMLAYIRFVERRTVRRYIAVLVLFALDLMSKPMVVTLPFVLLVMDYWPLQRLRPDETTAGEPLARLILEKIPLFALSVLSSVATFIAQKTGGAMARLSSFPLSYRISNVPVAYCYYILKMFNPVRLAAFYPHPGGGLAGWKIAASAMALLAITVVVVLFRRRRYLLAGWLWYLGTLVPVIGLVQVGAQAMADRYTYIPLTGLFIMLVWLTNDILGKWRYKAVLVGLGSTVIIGTLVFLSFKQATLWRDTITLFTHTAAVTTDNYVAHGLLGTAYAEKGDIETAMQEFDIVLKIRPKDADTLYNVAKGLALQGRTDEAIEFYNQVLSLVPGDAHTYSALASLAANNGDFERAIGMLREGLQFNPQDGSLHGELGSLFLQMGMVDEAIAELETAVNLKADSAIYGNLGLAVSAKGDTVKAMEYFNKAIRLNPANAEVHFNLGNSYLIQGQLGKAIGEYEMAIKTRPDYVKAYSNLAVALAQTGRLDKAIENFRRVTELDPNNLDAHFNLAAALAEKRLINEAIAEYEQVLKIDPNNQDAKAGLEKALAGQNATNQAAELLKNTKKNNPSGKTQE